MRPDRAVVGRAANIPPPPDRDEFLIRFETGELAVRQALGTLMGRLAPLGLTADTLGQTEIVVAEVLNNIVEHAYDIAGEVSLAVQVLPDSLRFTSVDAGHALPSSLLTTGSMPDIPVDPLDLPEGGFGWAMIRELTESLHYRRIEGQNHLSFSIRCGKNMQ